MPARQSVQNKIPVGGASDIRGAQRKTMTTTIKQEQPDDVAMGLPPSRQLLRRTLLDRRRARGLGEIPVQFVDSVKHELTREELEKKERRKEQNRRAARKCRMKKKQVQQVVAEDFSQIIDENKRLEEEIIQLRREKEVLEKVIRQHLQSGECRLVKPATITSQTASSTASSVPAAALSPATVTSQTASSTASSVPAAALSPTSTETAALSFEINNRMYLDDIGPIAPDQTFTDLEDLDMDPETLAQYLEELNSISPPSANIPSANLPQPFPPDSDPMESLKNIMPASPYTSCISSQSAFSPISPVTNHNRLSVSSVASDWSGATDQSQGFYLPNRGGSPEEQAARATVGSMSEAESMDMNCSGGFPPHATGAIGDSDEDDDDVFQGSFATVSVLDGNFFQQYHR